MYLARKVPEFASACSRLLCQAKHAPLPPEQHPWPRLSRIHFEQSTDLHSEMLKYHPYCASPITSKDPELIQDLLQLFCEQRCVAGAEPAAEQYAACQHAP